MNVQNKQKFQININYRPVNYNTNNSIFVHKNVQIIILNYTSHVF